MGAVAEETPGSRAGVQRPPGSGLGGRSVRRHDGGTTTQGRLDPGSARSTRFDDRRAGVALRGVERRSTGLPCGPRRAAAALEQARESASNTSGSAVPPTSRPPTTPATRPPVNASAAQVAVSAAMSVIGTTYVWGSGPQRRLRLLQAHLVGLGPGGRLHPALIGRPVLLAAARGAGERPAGPDLLLLPDQPRRAVHRRRADRPRGHPGRAARSRSRRCTATTRPSAPRDPSLARPRPDPSVAARPAAPTHRCRSHSRRRAPASTVRACRRLASDCAAVAYFSFSSALTISSKISFGSIGIVPLHPLRRSRRTVSRTSHTCVAQPRPCSDRGTRDEHAMKRRGNPGPVAPVRPTRRSRRTDAYR